jgi:general secretion pathway protein C
MLKIYHTIFSLIALTVIVYVGVDIFYRVVRSQLRQMNTQKIFTQRAPEVTQKKSPPLRDYQVINGRNLFGSVEKAVVNTKPEAIETLEPTSLKIALLGTVAGSEQNAVAVIEEKKLRKQGLYRVGDSVQGAVVKVILRGKVILRVGDKDEILTMEEDDSSKSGNGKGRSSASGDQTSIRVRRTDIEKSMKNINTLLSQVRIRPHFKNGEADGLSISRIRPNSIFTKLGLRNGDVVQAIDETPIQSPDDILSMYEKIKSGSKISIQITRRGRQKTINYEMR